ncbi:MAG: type II toxin-antitoxin system VapC family toxin [Cyanobacteria bacterium]|nr:type II toxin-antitoxin system VapC family toxin [Cyanobacteriota bacterium]
MILLDTNVISELSKPSPNPNVVAWLDANEWRDYYTSALTVAELKTGLAMLPDGKRKAELMTLVAELLDRFGRYPVAFEGLAADDYAKVIRARSGAGRPINEFDALIAATALCRGFMVATLNVKDFDGIDGLKLLDPST